MLAVAGRLPDPDVGWAYEFKWDGERAVAYLNTKTVRLLSRNDHDITVSYPELQEDAQSLHASPVVLDGEIVVFDRDGQPSFSRLQQRMHVTDPARAAELARQVPAAYFVFDVLFLDGHSTLADTYADRRAVLESLQLSGEHVHVPPWFEGPGVDVLGASIEQRLEGVVAKRLDSPYRPGRRSPDWVKVKHVRTQEVIVVGWAPGRGRRGSTIGALLLALPGPDGLRYVGRVGTGFTEAMLRDLAATLEPLARTTSPLRGALPARQSVGAHWVDPVLVGEVAFSQWTSEGRLRQPSWRGLRPDKDPDEVVAEP
jgi:bifunctional non-homologous end joining protein LigD